jgi:hypothetical protein
MINSNLWTAIATEAGVASTQLAHGLSELTRLAPTQTWSYGAVLFPLATAFERMGKLAIQIDTFLATGTFGAARKNHDIGSILSEVNRRCRIRWPEDDSMHQPGGDIERAVVLALTTFAQNGRYHSLQTIVTGSPNPKTDVPLMWHDTVVVPVLDRHYNRALHFVSGTQEPNPALRDIGVFRNRHITGEPVSDLEQILMAGRDYQDALPWTRVYVMRTARWLADVLISTGREALYMRRFDDIPDLSDFFRWTQNTDDHFCTDRRTFQMV